MEIGRWQSADLLITRISTEIGVVYDLLFNHNHALEPEVKYFLHQFEVW